MDQETQARKVENPNLAKIICVVLTIITLTTIILGFYFKNPFVIISGILPVAIYEAIRTEGYYTKAGSIAIMILVILEIFAIRGAIRLNLAAWLGREEIYFSGYFLPLGDIAFVFPAIAVIISLVLFFRTYGIYTKWLSILLLLSSATLLYLVNKETLFDLIKTQNYYY